MKRRHTNRIMITGLPAGLVCLSDAKTESYAICVDASILESYMRQPRLNRDTHAAEIDRMKNDINAGPGRRSDPVSEGRDRIPQAARYDAPGDSPSHLYR
jgi:hypothetical protein